MSVLCQYTSINMLPTVSADLWLTLFTRIYTVAALTSPKNCQNHPPLTSTEVKERVLLHLYSLTSQQARGEPYSHLLISKQFWAHSLVNTTSACQLISLFLSWARCQIIPEHLLQSYSLKKIILSPNLSLCFSDKFLPSIFPTRRTYYEVVGIYDKIFDNSKPDKWFSQKNIQFIIQNPKNFTPDQYIMFTFQTLHLRHVSIHYGSASGWIISKCYV
jgi:hypothetical protein